MHYMIAISGYAGSGMRICSGCKQEKSFVNFSIDHSRNSPTRYCRDCMRIASISHRLKIKEKIKSIIFNDTDKVYCNKCESWKTRLQFYKASSTKNGLSSFCKKCDQRKGILLRIKNKSRINVQIPKHKICCKCKTNKQSNSYFLDKSKKDGLNSICKECEEKRYIDERKAAFIALGGIKCNKCGITSIEFLTIQHINNDGKEHRIISNPRKLYKDVTLNPDRSSYEVLCICCNKEDFMDNYMHTKDFILNARKRLTVLKLISNGVIKCSCINCDETKVRRLCIDHIVPYKINNEGPRNKALYDWIIAKNKSDDEKLRRRLKFQILCHNCNMAKGVSNICKVHKCIT